MNIREYQRLLGNVKPTENQLRWFDMEMYAFIHFSPNTYTGLEWGLGNEDPAIFNPTELDCDGWVEAIKAAGLKVLLVPVAVAAGTLGCAALAGLFLPLGIKDAMAASAGFGWYSLAPTLLAPYSLSVSAVAFLSNVMREIFSIIAIPFVAKYLGYVECAALPGAAAMDTCLPVIARYSGERCAILALSLIHI